MSFLDNISKKISEGVERAKFEAEKLQRTVALQNELAEIKRQLDAKRMEFGDRAMELYKAGKIQSPTLGELMRAMEQLQVRLTLKEEELKLAHSQTYVEPQPSPGAQSVPINVEPATPPPSAQTRPGGAPDTKVCSNCSFQMPSSAVFCPNCGLRVAP